VSDLELAQLSLADAAELVRRREISAVELVEATLRGTESLAPHLGCFLTVLADDALRRAAELDGLAGAGAPLGPLHGVPVTVKDNIALAGAPTTAGAEFLREWRPAEDADVVRALRRAGAVVFAKAALSELAFGGTHSAFGFTRNPWDIGRTTGGSSSGSAAAVAAGLGYASIGTDTGGSIRVPASFCGVVGLKPTYEAVSRKGVVTLSSSLDHVGPLARSARDARLVLDAIATGGPADTPALPHAPTLGIPAQQPGERVDDEVRAAVDAAAAVFGGQGARIVEVELPDLLDARAALWTIASVEAAEFHRGRLVESPADFHPVVRARLEHGAAVQGIDYVRAQRVRQKLIEQTHALLARVDAVILPTAPIAAHELGAATVLIDGEPEETGAAVSRYTPLFSLTGCPAVSIPCGVTRAGLPIGLQIAARPGADRLVLAIAELHERASGARFSLPVRGSAPTAS
jgi:aspartyl-tRNA(Asn)/glutamyl-tRNA(Gln) amidotransferase subunit A